jgi:hypothetical protein
LVDKQRREERSRLLWGERRGLFARVLDAADAIRLAVLDLRGIDIRSSEELTDRPVRTVDELRQLQPEAARALEAMYAVNRICSEVHLLCDAEVRGAIENLRTTLGKSFRAAVVGSEDNTDERGFVTGLAVRAMRRELVYGGPSTGEDHSHIAPKTKTNTAVAES